MTDKPAKRPTSVQRAFLLGLRRAKARRRAEQREMEDRFDDRLSELQDDRAALADRLDPDDE